MKIKILTSFITAAAVALTLPLTALAQADPGAPGESAGAAAPGAATSTDTGSAAGAAGTGTATDVTGAAGTTSPTSPTGTTSATRATDATSATAAPGTTGATAGALGTQPMENDGIVKHDGRVFFVKHGQSREVNEELRLSEGIVVERDGKVRLQDGTEIDLADGRMVTLQGELKQAPQQVLGIVGGKSADADAGATTTTTTPGADTNPGQ